VRYRRKYYATNRLSLSAKEVRTLYRKRQEVEEVVKVLKSQRSLEACKWATGGTEPLQSSHSRVPKSITLLCVSWPIWWWSGSG
jgi:hypothetical protein